MSRQYFLPSLQIRTTPAAAKKFLATSAQCAHLRHTGTPVKAPIGSLSRSRAERVGQRTISIPRQRNGAVLERDESCATEEDVQGTSKYWLTASPTVPITL